eukprot:TRINITY_DN48243_c0_g1_i1.p1 TRINITY_DN48243_c0_g1~~TRINITY_DN48243_c0_g1_i1.p1  ORF type:complete len:886 (-),score=147.94 TRINITY_DN48243_c0_g1_i1:15-2321(-)
MEVEMRPPCPPMRLHEVPFGVVEGEDRGENAMDPPIFRADPWFWLRDSEHEDPEVQKLLKDEDEYCRHSLSHLQRARERIYSEMMGHTKEDDTDVPAPDMDGYAYYCRSFKGKAYKAHYRAKIVRGLGCIEGANAGCQVPSDVRAMSSLVGMEIADEQLILDENSLIQNSGDSGEHPYLSVKGPTLSHDCAVYSFAKDLKGNDCYSIGFRRFGSQDSRDIEDPLQNTDGSMEWDANGHAGLYYVGLDGEFRSETVRRHVLGTKQQQDMVVLHEEDGTFNVSISKTHDRRMLMVSSCSAETSEHYLVDLQEPSAGLICVGKRRAGLRYDVDHCDGSLYILTNKDGCKNMKLCRTSVAALRRGEEQEAWQDVWVPGPQVKLDGMRCFGRFIALEGRESGVRRIFVLDYQHLEAMKEPRHLEVVIFPEAQPHSGTLLTPRSRTAAMSLYSVGFHTMRMFDTDTMRLYRADYCCPSRIYSYHVPSKAFKLLKEEPAPGFDRSRYRAERITSQRRGVPISLVYRADLHSEGLRGGPYPTLLTGYGAYGNTSDPDFDLTLLSLLDRGVLYAVAHVRGGGELGEEWALQGRKMNVKNRFLDFEAAADTLLALGLCEKSRLVAWGESSGGLLVSATANMRPDLFTAMLLEVPFVDALNTMSDPTIPLTCNDWAESGNTNEREAFHYVMEYSPYDNIRLQAYPATLCTASLNDTMVGYWEPLKYVTKLRRTKLDDKPVRLKVNFDAGHGHHADRYEYLKERAFNFAFILDQLGVEVI